MAQLKELTVFGSTRCVGPLYANDIVGAMRSFNVSVPTSGWTADSTNGGVYLTITVSGVTAADNPVAGLVASANSTTAASQEKAYGLIYKITTAANAITLRAKSTPATAFTLRLICV